MLGCRSGLFRENESSGRKIARAILVSGLSDRPERPIADRQPQVMRSRRSYKNTTTGLSAIAINVEIGHARPREEPLASHLVSSPLPATQEALAGTIERATFHNAENGFWCWGRRRAASAIS